VSATRGLLAAALLCAALPLRAEPGAPAAGDAVDSPLAAADSTGPVAGSAARPGARGREAPAAPRPFVIGGYDDKPWLTGFFGRIRVGGYVEALGAWAREGGVTGELGTQLTRWNLLAATELGPRVRVFSELEFEEGGAEVTLELVQVDVRLVDALQLRAGMLLLPLGRFNLAHDAPRNELPGRPAEAEQLLGVALAQPGLGGFGLIERAGSRLTWELYAVNGYHDGLLTASPEGTRLPAGRRNPEDANASPALVGRLEWSRGARASVGVSGYHGAYNVYRLEGLDVDERRDVGVAALDLEATLGPVTLSGEAAGVRVELPPSLAGVFAARQGGLFVQVAAPFALPRAPTRSSSRWTAAARVDVVDLDRDRPGDSLRSWTLGVNVRPAPETACKLAFTRGETRDRFDNLATFARLELGVATYF